MPSRLTILDDLRAVLRDFQGREYAAPIDDQTCFFADLGFASIDAVILGEQLEQYYDCSLPFHQFLSDAAMRGAEDVRVGELADFLSRAVPEP